MKIIRNPILPFGSYKAMAVGPFILVKNGATMTDVDINHEAIHWEQQKELVIVGFYLLYVVVFVYQLIRTGQWKRAYRRICFEREAYDNEQNQDYIKQRRHYAWARH